MAKTKNNLASAYLKQGKYSEAELLYKQVRKYISKGESKDSIRSSHELTRENLDQSMTRISQSGRCCNLTQMKVLAIQLSLADRRGQGGEQGQRQEQSASPHRGVWGLAQGGKGGLPHCDHDPEEPWRLVQASRQI